MVMTDRTMPPVGPQMDELVAEALGEDTKFPAYYSRDTHGIAMDALEAWREQHPGTEWRIRYVADGGYVVEILKLQSVSFGVRRLTLAEVRAPTLEASICEAIIRAHWALEDAR